MAGEIPVEYMQKVYVFPSDLHRLNSSEAASDVQEASAVTPFASPSQHGKSSNVDSVNLHGTSQLRLGSVLCSNTDVEVNIEKDVEGQVLEIDGGNSNSKRSFLNKTYPKNRKTSNSNISRHVKLHGCRR